MLFRETVILTMLVMNRQLIDFGGKHFNPARGEGVCPGRFQATGEGAVLAAPGRGRV